MKKVLTVFMFTCLMVLGFASNVEADEHEMIDLYPYDKIECLNAEDTCTNYKVGDANWDLEYNGYRYHFVNGSVRYASEFTDDNSDGFIDALELPAIGWNGFAALNINNTENEVILKTQNARTDLTSVVHRIYAYYDENGKLAMFEDHYVTEHYIFNDGDETTPDWRLATQAEADAYDAADPKPADTMLTNIRIALDDTDPDGYVIEPLASLAWHAQGVDTTTQPESEWSSIIDNDPNNVVMPAGWTVMSFGTLDRDGTNDKTVDFIGSLVDAMAADTAAANVEYTDQPADFTGLTAQDDDAVTPGINIVVDYQFDFDMPTGISASWTNMFDESGNIINEVEMLDYSVTISRDGTDLETIDYTWDNTEEEYTASAEQTVIDSNEFGAGYLATYSVTTPEGDVTEVEVDIVVGVMPPRFENVEDRYINEDVMVDLLGDITADDGYGADLTDSIMITMPDGFNPYYPQPGEYQIDLEFTHKVVFEAPDSEVTIDGVTTTWDNSYYNSVTALSDSSEYAIWTDETMVQDVTWGYGRVLALVGADGLVDAVYDRYSWDVNDETGEWNDGGATFETWKSGISIEDGGFVIGSYGSTLSAALRALQYDDPVSFDHKELDTVTIDGATLEWNRDQFNSVTGLNTGATTEYAIFTKDDMAQDVGWAWGSVMVLVGADGLVDAVYDRYTWDIDDETGAWVGDADVFADWKAALAIEDGGFVIGSHGSTISPLLRELTYDDPVSFDFGELDFEYDIVTTDSYMLTVDDTTVPTALVVNPNLQVVAGEHSDTEDVILGNVVAMDNYDTQDDLAIYVSNNGGLMLDTAGTYTVEVTVEDTAGNSSMATFDVIVVEPELTQSDLDDLESDMQDLIDNLDFLTPQEVQDLIDGGIADIDIPDEMTAEQVQELIDEYMEEQATGCGSSVNVGLSVFAALTVMGGGVLFFLRKQ